MYQINIVIVMKEMLKILKKIQLANVNILDNFVDAVFNILFLIFL